MQDMSGNANVCPNHSPRTRGFLHQRGGVVHLGVRWLLILLGVLILGGCRTGRNVREQVKDTVYSEKTTIVEPRVIDRVIIEKICDTITNEVVKFEKEFIIGTDTVYVATVDESLIVEISRLKQVVQEQSERFEKSIREKDEKVVVKRVPLWVYITFGAIAVFLFLYLRRLL